MSDPTPEPRGEELVDIYAEVKAGPEPTEERRPTTMADWRALTDELLECLTLDCGDEACEVCSGFTARRDALLAAEPEHLPDEVERLKLELDETIDDLTLSLRVRNAALEQAALDYQPGPDGQDYLDRSRHVLRWIEAAYEELEIDVPPFADPPVLPKPSLTAWVRQPEHLPVFHVVEGMDYKLVSGEHITHWHVRVVARNGLTFQTDSVSEKRLALEAAEWLAALTGGTVVEG